MFSKMAQPMHIVLVSLIFLSISTHIIATRVRLSETETVIKPKFENFFVDLYVTRHALSCANIASDWKGSRFLGPVSNKSSAAAKLIPNRVVPDPILASAGVQGSLEMQAHITDKIARRVLGVEPDAVLSSELVRSVETALLQYPGKPIHVVPWLREAGFKAVIGEGLDNLPSRRDDQAKNLQMALDDIPGYQGPPILVDKWMADLHGEEGNWTMFLNFLGETFLPAILPRLGKPKGSKITLAIVTHSMLMAKTPDLQDHCGHLWAENKKPYNNQAVKITYSAFTSSVANTSGIWPDIYSDTNEQTRWNLVLQNGCSEVAPGLSYKGRELCRRDIGPVCLAKLSEASVSSPTTLEDKISSLEENIASKMNPSENASVLKSWLLTPRQGVDALTKLREQLEAMQSTRCIDNTLLLKRSQDTWPSRGVRL